NPDRVLWPEMGVTKRDLAGYYRAVADRVLPGLRDRPLMLLRCPSGTADECFYQKHAKASIPGAVPRVRIPEAEGPATYLYVNGLAALMGLVQIGALELHVWAARRDRLDRPDRLVFDLDPDAGLPFGRTAAAALALRALLDDLGLRSFPKLTGGKGLHVVAPLVRRSGWDEARAFARAVAARLEAEDPDGYTTESAKEKREDRIFLDYLRNARNATGIAEYSPRARDGAPVAVPIPWTEVDPGADEPPRYSIADLPDRIDAGDPWPGFADVRQSITKEMRNALGLE
ncbi:MAG: non-homologous end-joining DNA ligase, partial [Gemmatimonadota bacterium]